MDEAQLKAIATRIAQEYGIPVAAFLNLIGGESGWNPRAYNPKSGAASLAQGLPSTIRGYGYTPEQLMADPELALRFAAEVLTDNRTILKTSDWAPAFSAYFIGPGNIAKAMETGGANWLAAADQLALQYEQGTVSDFFASHNLTELVQGGAAAPTQPAPKQFWDFGVTQGFGPTDETLDSGYAGYAHFNKGIDYATPAGTPIAATVAGTVTSVGDTGDGWGTRVQIRDAEGNTHNYGHLDGFTVQTGQQIAAGQAIGTSGNTGRSTGPHLSYDVWTPDGTFINPVAYVESAKSITPPATGSGGLAAEAPPGFGAPGTGTTTNQPGTAFQTPGFTAGAAAATTPEGAATAAEQVEVATNTGTTPTMAPQTPQAGQATADWWVANGYKVDATGQPLDDLGIFPLSPDEQNRILSQLSPYQTSDAGADFGSYGINSSTGELYVTTSDGQRRVWAPSGEVWVQSGVGVGGQLVDVAGGPQYAGRYTVNLTPDGTLQVIDNLNGVTVNAVSGYDAGILDPKKAPGYQPTREEVLAGILGQQAENAQLDELMSGLETATINEYLAGSGLRYLPGSKMVIDDKGGQGTLVYDPSTGSVSIEGWSKNRSVDQLPSADQYGNATVNLPDYLSGAGVLGYSERLGRMITLADIEASRAMGTSSNLFIDVYGKAPSQGELEAFTTSRPPAFMGMEGSATSFSGAGLPGMTSPIAMDSLTINSALGPGFGQNPSVGAVDPAVIYQNLLRSGMVDIPGMTPEALMQYAALTASQNATEAGQLTRVGGPSMNANGQVVDTGAWLNALTGDVYTGTENGYGVTSRDPFGQPYANGFVPANEVNGAPQIQTLTQGTLDYLKSGGTVNDQGQAYQTFQSGAGVSEDRIITNEAELNALANPPDPEVYAARLASAQEQATSRGINLTPSIRGFQFTDANGEVIPVGPLQGYSSMEQAWAAYARWLQQQQEQAANRPKYNALPMSVAAARSSFGAPTTNPNPSPRSTFRPDDLIPSPPPVPTVPQPTGPRQQTPVFNEQVIYRPPYLAA